MEPVLSLPASSSPSQDSPLIAGSVLPIQRAEELLATLPGVISARIVASSNGAVDEIHLLTTTDVPPKQTVRNVESALMAHLGMRVSHKKISVATSDDPQRSTRAAHTPAYTPEVTMPAVAIPSPVGRPVPTPAGINGRRIYFEDVEVRRSRSKGVACRVTLKKGDESFVGEAEGMENERSRIELAARAALQALAQAEPSDRALALDGVRLIEAFDREFVFVGVTARLGRTSALLTGSCEIRESAETASVLAVLDATNRWIAHTR